MTWEDACASVIQNTRQRDGIGRLREKTVHAVIKAYLEEDPTRMEQKVGSFWADILREDGSIVEIQTGNFYKLSRKLEALLPQHKVEVVYPVIVQKDVIWIQEDGGMLPPHKSPKKGCRFDVLEELPAILPYLSHPNFCLHLLFLDADEYRLLNGRGRNKKKGATHYDRIPGRLQGEEWYRTKEDYLAFLPALPEEFTAKEYGQAAKLTPRSTNRGLYVLKNLCLIEQCGKRGRAYLYRIRRDDAS